MVTSNFRNKEKFHAADEKPQHVLKRAQLFLFGRGRGGVGGLIVF